MKPKYLLATLAPIAIGAALFAVASDPEGQDQKQTQLTAGTPALEPLQLLEARPFVLDEPFTHYWRKERPSFSGGYLLVLRADPAFLRPRQTYEPVLFVGTETAARLNDPSASGCLICLVPAPVSPQSRVQLNPSQEPIWFGPMELPERITAQRAQQELTRALALGVQPIGPALRAAGQRGQKASAMATTYMKNRTELDLVIADLVETYSPTETDLIESLRMPLTR